LKKPLINNQIRASQVRIIDETGKQLGIMPLEEGIRLAKEKNLDLIQVTEKVEPPVCKIMDYGKYLYKEKKKEKTGKSGGKLKVIRLSFGISAHDLETRVKYAEKFLQKGYIIKVELILKGRQKALFDFAKAKVSQFLESLEKLTKIKVERELKKENGKITIILSKIH
jgi:translation initiation factor IF-3